MRSQILFVDDLATNQRFYEAVLNRHFPDQGFLSALSFQQAIKLFADHLSETSVVVLEVSVEGGPGLGLLKRLMLMKPDLRGIVVSAYLPGYPSNPTMTPGGRFADAQAIIRKPFEVALLVGEIRKALDYRQAR